MSVSLNPVDEITRKIIKEITLQGPLSSYKLGKTLKINHVTVKRKIEERFNLVNEGILQKTSAERSAEPYSLTFFGVLYALQFRIILPRQAALARQKSKAEIPQPKRLGIGLGSWITQDFLVDFIKSVASENIEEKLGKWQNATKTFYENYSNILDQHQKPEESCLFKEVEKLYSKFLYSNLLYRVNLYSYDEGIAGSQYHQIMFLLWRKFFQQIFMEGKHIKLFLKCAKEDKEAKVVQEMIEKAFIPGFSKLPGMPRDFAQAMIKLSSTVQKIPCQSPRKIERNIQSIQKWMRKGMRKVPTKE